MATARTPYLTCTYCGSFHANDFSMRTHHGMAHPDLNYQVVPAQVRAVAAHSAPAGAAAVYACSTCDFEGTSTRLLTLHQRRHESPT